MSKEGSKRYTYSLKRGERVDVVYRRRNIPWHEEGLEGVIPGVLVGVDKTTGEIITYPPEATPTIKAWRERTIENRGLVEKRREAEWIRAQMKAARDEMEELERLGLLDEDGCILEGNEEVT